MLLSFHLTVSALAEAIIREQCRVDDARIHPCEAVTRFLLATHARMPDHMRIALRYLTLAFDAWSLPSSGRAFHHLPHAGRCRQIQAWKGSALGFRRDLIKLYETLAVFGWYAERYGQDYGHDGDA